MSAAASSTWSVCSKTSRWWNGLCSQPRIGVASGRIDVEDAEPVEQADGRVGMVGRRGGAAPRRRSARRAGRSARWASRRASRSASGSTSNPSSWAIRARRSSRSGSSVKTRSETSAQPALGQVAEAAERVDDVASPSPSTGIAIAFTVKSRSPRSARISPPRCAVMSTRAAVEHDAPRPVAPRRARTATPRSRGRAAGRRSPGRRAPRRRRRSPGRPRRTSRTHPPTKYAPVVADQAPELVKHLGGHAPPSVAEERATSRSRS